MINFCISKNAFFEFKKILKFNQLNVRILSLLFIFLLILTAKLQLDFKKCEVLIVKETLKTYHWMKFHQKTEQL